MKFSSKSIVIVIVLILFSFSLSAANKNIVINGSFDSDLSGWSFQNTSHTGSVCASWGDYAESETYHENGKAVIHAKYGYGEGKLYQTFNPVKPKRLKVDYRAYSPSGNCNSDLVYFYDSSGNKVAGFYYGEDSFVPRYSIWDITLMGVNHRLNFNSKYSEGTMEFYFDWDNRVAKAIWHSPNGITEELVSEPINSDINVAKVELIVHNSCCDGRNNAYGYFDDVVVEPVSQNTFSASQLLAHYSFNYCDGRDTSGNGFNGEIMGNPECVTGVDGKALYFDGYNDWIKVNHIFSLKDFTISLWFKTTSNDIQGFIQTTDGSRWGLPGVGIVLLNDNDLEIDYRSDYRGSKCEIHAKNLNLADGRWHMVTLVRNTSVGRGYLYIDGDLTGSCSDPSPGKKIESQSYLRIGYGYYYTRGDFPLKGYLDDVRIYNYPLNQSEILNLYQQANHSEESNVKYTLYVSKSGTGNGVVTSYPSGINCGSTCSAQFDEKERVTLTATAYSNSEFSSWGEDCGNCGNNPTCTVIMNSHKSCVAEFNTPQPSNSPPNKPTISGSSSGTVGQRLSFIASTADPDGDSVSFQFNWGDSTESGWGSRAQSHIFSEAGRYCVRVRAKDSHGAESIWSNCYYVMITAQKYTLRINKRGTGNGVVYSSPSGINCGYSCSGQFEKDSSVTLRAVPDSDSVFSGWSGDCSICQDIDICTIFLDSSKSCVARFEKSISEKSIPKKIYPGDCVKINVRPSSLLGRDLNYRLIFSPSSSYENRGQYVVGVYVVYLKNNSGFPAVYDKAYLFVSPYALGIYSSLDRAYAHDKLNYSTFVPTLLKKLYEHYEKREKSTPIPVYFDVEPIQKEYNYACFFPVYVKKSGWWLFSDYDLFIDPPSSENKIWLVDKGYFVGIILSDVGAFFIDSNYYLDPLVNYEADKFFNEFLKPRYINILLNIGISVINKYLSMINDFYQNFSLIFYYFTYISEMSAFYNFNKEAVGKDSFTHYSKEVGNYLKELLINDNRDTYYKLLDAMRKLNDEFDKLYSSMNCMSFTDEASITSATGCDIDNYLILTNPIKTLYFYVLFYFEDQFLLTNIDKLSGMRKEAASYFLENLLKNYWAIITF